MVYHRMHMLGDILIVITCTAWVKVKVKITLEHATKAKRGSRCIALLFSSTLALDGGGWSTPPPAALPLGKIRYPLYRRLGGPQGRLDGCGKSCPHRDSIPGPYSPYRVAILTALSHGMSNITKNCIRTLFINLWYAYHYWYLNQCLLAVRKKRNIKGTTILKINVT